MIANQTFHTDDDIRPEKVIWIMMYRFIGCIGKLLHIKFSMRYCYGPCSLPSHIF